VIAPDQGLASMPGAAAKVSPDGHPPGTQLGARPLLGMSVALTLAALAWGFVNFGVMLWLPASLIAGGRA